MKRIVIPFLALLVLLTACGSGATPTAAPASDGKTGIKGQVFLAECQGPEVATDCFSQEPYQATLIVYNSNFEEVARILTKTDGTFEFEIEAGEYYIHPYSPAQYPIAPDYRVVVSEGQMTELTVIYDSGVR